MTSFFAEYGLVAVFGFVLLEQLGAPIPALPVLLLAGAKAIDDPMYLVYTLVLSILACTIGDLAWFWAGRRYGYRVLKLLCRVSLSPDSCVRQTESTYERRGVATLVVAKFVPGLATVAPPVAGALGLKTSSFLAYNGAGAALYCGAGLVLGLLFHGQIDWLIERLVALGARALLVIFVLLGLYVAYRWWDRRRFLKSLRTARIGVDELYAMMSRGDDPVVLDVRSRTHRELDGRRIPGARPVDLDDLERTLAEIPRDRDVVVYCACPNEATAVKVAMLLRDRGIRRVRPLAGGIDAWVAAGLGIENLTVERETQP
ncbi:MAG: VTT domain-containing protein [Betaproteobacteria bacterium]|nr:VTT domain-containing protein [Betaproteobacteria bacterium]